MPSARPPLTQARLKELLHYDPETGHFTWLVNRGVARAGRAAPGGFGSHGYRQYRIDGQIHLGHRLAYLYMVGGWPSADIDHVNQDRSDNRWVNLRAASRSQNVLNSGLHKNNTSGFRGVSWCKTRCRWVAHGKLDGKFYNLGLFDDLEDAAAVAQRWREENFGIFAATGQAHPVAVVS